jgi:cytosine/adenosine deaminase-related metal-dependent hydrolase
MAYQKLKGDHLFDGSQLWESGKVLVTDGKGNKIDIVEEEDAGEDIIHIPGLISPGFVNAHCHLELSHLKNTVPPHTTLIPFLLQVVNKRDYREDAINTAIKEALLEMENDGIIAIGDICNTTHTIAYKSAGNLQWMNFIEVLSFTDARAVERLEHFNSIREQFEHAGAGRSSLSPHAPYSISDTSFQMINEATEGRTISIHNQESPAENELFQTGRGRFIELFAHFGFHGSPFPVTGTTSIRHYLPFFNRGQKIILVHNTFMPEEDILWANEYAKQAGISLVYCFCVNANLYIEDRLPALEKFMALGCEMVLGTDSYSSNWQLKITEEILAIQANFPDIPVEAILQWATVNGAKALNANTKWISGSDLIERMKNGQ